MGGREALPAYRRAVSAGVVVYTATVAILFLPLIQLLGPGQPRWAAGAFPLCAGLALFPLGGLSAHRGRRPTTLMALLVLGLGQIGEAVCSGSSPEFAGCFRIFSGLGSAGAAAFSWSVEISDLDDRGKKAGAVAAGAGVAAAVGLPMGALLSTRWPWAPGALGALLATAAAAWVWRAALPPQSDCPPPTIRDELRFAFSSRQVVGVSLAALGSLAAAGALLGIAGENLGLGEAELGLVGILGFMAISARLADRGGAAAGAALVALLPLGALELLSAAPPVANALALMGVALPFVSVPTALVSKTPEMLRPVGYLVTQAATLVGLGLGLILWALPASQLVWMVLAVGSAIGLVIA